MARTTIDFGIDLGTTNSAIAVTTCDEIEVVPSVVSVDAEGERTVGAEARAKLDTDPSNTRGEFKRLMGTNTSMAFDAAGISLTPEELSAEVLKHLIAQVREQTGEKVDCAVITVPALFEIPQNEATERAAALAGIVHAPLLQEPIAAALAYGFGKEKVDRSFWMVYDFGGGTFDASVVSVRDGRLSVVDHDGDNFLGGKDLDSRLLDLVIGRIRDRHDIPALESKHPGFPGLMASLRAAVVAGRERLSDELQTVIADRGVALDDTGQPLDLEVKITRQEFNRLVLPEISRSVDICERLLDRNRLESHDVARLVLVGGVTRTPMIRQLLTERLGIELECDLDPATTVARGAAIHAASLRRPALEERQTPIEGHALRLEYPSVSQDERPYIVGRFLEDEKVRPNWIEIRRADAGWQSGRISISDQGAFICQVDLIEGGSSSFELRAGTDEGPVKIDPHSFQITHGLAVAAPPLSRSLGVGLADNAIHFYIRRGTSLPAKATHLHRTTTALEPGRPGAVIDVPVVQGESERADRNRHIGTLCIPATRIRRALPINSEVEVTVEIDGSSTVRAKAYVPFLDQVFEQVLSTKLVPSTPEELEQDLELAFRRREKLEESPEGEVVVGEIGDGPFDEVIRDIAAASLGDQDAALRAQRRLLELHERLDKAETDVRWPRKVSEAHHARVSTSGSIEEHGSPADQELFTGLDKEVGIAIAARDLRTLERKTSALWRLRHRVLSRRPEYWIDLFWWLERRKESMSPRRRALGLIEEGKSAIDRQDYHTLERVVVDLDVILAPEDTDRPPGLRSHVK
jgi:molecular chaperone DnaK